MVSKQAFGGRRLRRAVRKGLNKAAVYLLLIMVAVMCAGPDGFHLV